MNIKFKRLLSSSAMAGLVVASLGQASPAHAAASVVLTLDSQTVATPGGTFVTPIKIAAGTGIRGIQLDLKFNPAVAQIKTVVVNPTFWSDPGVMCVDGQGGEIIIDTPFTNKGKIYNVTGTLSALASAPLGVPDGGFCTTTADVIVATLTFTATGNGRSDNEFDKVKIPGPNGINLLPGTASGSYSAVGNFFQVGTATPVPTATTQVPTATAPVPTATAPVPTATTPIPTATTQVPTATTPVPTATTPVPTATAPVPTATTPVPTATTPVSTATTPEPTATTEPTATMSPTLPPHPTATSSVPTSTPGALTDSGMTHVDAVVEKTGYLSISTDKSVNFGKLALGQNSVKGKLTIKSNLSWQVTVSDYSPIVEPKLPKIWHMSQWNTSSSKFVIPGASLIDPLKVSAGQTTVSEGTPSTLLTGDAGGNNDQSFDVTYNQNLNAQDKALSSGQTYHIILKYVAFATL